LQGAASATISAATARLGNEAAARCGSRADDIMPRHASSPASTALGDVVNGRHHVVAVFVIRALDLRHEAADQLGSKPLRGIRHLSRIRCVRNEPAQGLGERYHPALSYRRVSIAIDGGAS